jgi:hypothetical protein
MTRARLFAAASTVAALAGFLALETNAYSTFGKWGTLSVSFYVNPANRDVSQNAAISALQTAMNVWNSQSGTSFRFNYAGQVSTTTVGNNRKNVVLFRNTTNGGAIASTYAWSSNGYLVDADIILWDGGWKFFTGSGGCSSGVYVEDIASHEFGHAMGLRHSAVTEATMYYKYSRCSQTMRTLSSDDIAGAKKLYGGSSGGTTVATDTAPVVTIVTPANGARVSPTTQIAFSGTATDVPDGNISSKLIWKTNLSGQIGTGATFSRTLPKGTHTVTATVKDSIGYTIAKSIVVYVQ